MSRKNQNLANVARNAALADMKAEGMDVATIESATLPEATAPEATAPEATSPIVTPTTFDVAFIQGATSLLSSRNVVSIPVADVIAEMSKHGFTFAPKGETDKAPKGKPFAGCNTEKQANQLYKFLVGTLRNKSTVLFSVGALKGKTLYYSECKVFASDALPVDSVNAWKEAYKLSVSASGK